ncbi:amino acid ABC transporter permease [Halobaculum sp. EA56]|uniref:amino acid ABC transporter permease n=1 Tax=Halobaculum sp. EA56 TaxID=3421648 RepID=UPI003EB7EA58
MAGSYSEDATADPEVREAVSGETLRRIGIVGTALFTLLVVGFIGLIVVREVDPSLAAEVVYPQFLQALFRVIQVVVVGSVLSILAGLIVGFARVSKTRFTRTVAVGYIEFFRGTPLLFQLLVIYIGIPSLWAPGAFPFEDWSYPAAIIGLTLNHAAYVGEAFRGGINAVPDGQMEAARSLGMSYIQAMREVILPQAWRNALAAIGNDQVILVKDTSLLSVLAFPELISFFQNVNSATFDAWTPILLVAVGYLAITIPLGKTVRYLEGRADWEGRDR